jgi:hypothetical protein
MQPFLCAIKVHNVQQIPGIGHAARALATSFILSKDKPGMCCASCNTASILPSCIVAAAQTTRIPDAALLHVNYANLVEGLLPYSVAIDEARRCVVLAIRGSLSVEDCVTGEERVMCRSGPVLCMCDWRCCRIALQLMRHGLRAVLAVHGVQQPECSTLRNR